MKTARPMRWTQRLILCLWCAALPGLVGAEVMMEARLGLQETVRLEKWNQIIVRLHNSGQPVSGTLGVRVWRGSEMRGDLHVASFTQPVSLSQRARKRFAFTVPITSISRPVEVFLRRGDEVLQRQSLDLRTALSAEQVILGLTRDLSLDFLATLLPTHTRIVYLPQDELPQRWYGYDSVSAIVLKGVSLQSLSETQTRALRQWIAGGGTLVVASDSRVALLTEPRLQALLPVQVLGVEQRDGLPELAAHYGVPMQPAPLIAMRSRLTQGEVLVGSADAPLLAQRGFGNGRVVFLAVDYATQPLAGWRGNQALWHDMLQPAERIDFSRVFAELGLLDERHPAVEILSRPVLLYPSHIALGVLLTAYCGVLGGLFWIIKRHRLRLAAACLVVALPLLAFTAAGYGLLAQHSLHRSALVFDLTTLEVLPGTGYSRLRGAVGVFSVHGGRYTLPLQQPETMMRHTFTRGAGTGRRSDRGRRRRIDHHPPRRPRALDAAGLLAGGHGPGTLAGACRTSAGQPERAGRQPRCPALACRRRHAPRPVVAARHHCSRRNRVRGAARRAAGPGTTAARAPLADRVRARLAVRQPAPRLHAGGVAAPLLQRPPPRRPRRPVPQRLAARPRHRATRRRRAAHLGPDAGRQPAVADRVTAHLRGSDSPQA